MESFKNFLLKLLIIVIAVVVFAYTYYLIMYTCKTEEGIIFMLFLSGFIGYIIGRNSNKIYPNA